MKLYKRPEKETDPDKLPGQIVYRPTHFETPLVKEVEEYQACSCGWGTDTDCEKCKNKA